jgi:hypothetical protein
VTWKHQFRVISEHVQFSKSGFCAGNAPGLAHFDRLHPAVVPQREGGAMKLFLLALFAFAGGLALSGIVANLYRILARRPKSRKAKTVYYVVMILAGPSVLFENATRSFRKKDCSTSAYGFAVALASYWAFVIGLMVVDIGLAL